jgi:hypothetical protein
LDDAVQSDARTTILSLPTDRRLVRRLLDVFHCPAEPTLGAAVYTFSSDELVTWPALSQGEKIIQERKPVLAVMREGGLAFLPDLGSC